MLHKLERRDRNLYKGGLAVYDRSDIPSRRHKDLNVIINELTFDVNLIKTKRRFYASRDYELE